MRRLGILLALLLLAPAAAGRSVDERGRPEDEEGRVDAFVLLKWTSENVGPTNFTRERTTPRDALHALPADVVRVLRTWWADPYAPVPDAQARRANDAILRYCLERNEEVFARGHTAFVQDLHDLAPGSRVRTFADGMGLVLIDRVPVDALPLVADLPYVSNVGLTGGHVRSSSSLDDERDKAEGL